MTTTFYSYDLGAYNFTKIIADYLATNDLSALSAATPGDEQTLQNSLYKNMEQTPAYRQLHECLHGKPGAVFYRTYERFIREVIRTQYEEPIYYQKKPTHRILYRDTPGVSRFHRDRDYGHSIGEINYFVPQTRAFATNTVWIESAEGKEDFSPMELDAGQFARFNGASLLHGAKVNDTNKTRVSFDFRVIPASKTASHFIDVSDWKEEDRQPERLGPHHFMLCQ